jgi:hypothetical protein
MNLCSSTHEEVCYGGRFCPACKLLERIKELEDEIEALNEEIREERG